jgi:uncharacterized protein YndB with AHSA1/START domain
MTITKEILIEAPVERVFTALTSSEEIPQYFPLRSVESEWQPGAAVRYNGEIEGRSFTDFGVIETLDFPTEYSYRYWSNNRGMEDTRDNPLTICYHLEEVDGGARLTVEQCNLRSEIHFERMNDHMWDFLLSSLKKYVEAKT